MPRLRQVPRADAPPEVITLYDMLFGDRDPVAEPGTATGTPGNWWTVMALVPEVFRHAVAGFVLYRGSADRLDPVLRELGQTRAGYARGSQFVYSQHCKSMRALGVDEAKIEAIASWGSSDVFTPEERAVLAYTDDLVLSSGRVSDATFDALRSFLSDEQILEFTYITCTYDLHATMCRALRMEFDDVPERLVEIAAPEGLESTDVMGQVADTQE
jgi:alkylhydroperoxidase family enzyme